MIVKYIIRRDHHDRPVGLKFCSERKKAKVGSKKNSWIEVDYVAKKLAMTEGPTSKIGEGGLVGNSNYVIRVDNIQTESVLLMVESLKASGYIIQKVNSLGRIMR